MYRIAHFVRPEQLSGAICDVLRASRRRLLPRSSTLIGEHIVEPHSHKAEACSQTKVPEHDDFLISRANIEESEARALPTLLDQCEKEESDQVDTASAPGRIRLCGHADFEKWEKTLMPEAMQHLSKGEEPLPAKPAATGASCAIC